MVALVGAAIYGTSQMITAGLDYSRQDDQSQRNKRAALQNAQQILINARSVSAQLERQSQRQVGEQRAAFAASGVRQEGSAKLVTLETRLDRIEQQELLFDRARKEAARIRTQARRTRQTQKRAARINLVSTQLSGGLTSQQGYQLSQSFGA